MPSITNEKENNLLKHMNNDLTFITNEGGKNLKVPAIFKQLKNIF